MTYDAHKQTNIVIGCTYRYVHVSESNMCDFIYVNTQYCSNMYMCDTICVDTQYCKYELERMSHRCDKYEYETLIDVIEK